MTRLRTRNNALWGESQFFFPISGPIRVQFDEKGEATEKGSPELSSDLVEAIKLLDPQGVYYKLYSADTENEMEKSAEEKIKNSPDGQDDLMHGVDPVEKALSQPSEEKTKQDRERSGVEAEVADTAEEEVREDEKVGVSTEKKDNVRLAGGEGKGAHGIVEKEQDPKKIDDADNKRSGVNTKKRDSSNKLMAEDNVKHGIAADEPKSSARNILGSDPRDELKTSATKALREDPRKTLKENKNKQLYEDPRKELTSSPLDEPKIPEEGGSDTDTKA